MTDRDYPMPPFTVRKIADELMAWTVIYSGQLRELVARTRPDGCPCDRRASGEDVRGYCDECAQRGDWAAPHPMTEPDVTVREIDGRDAELCIAIADHRSR